MISFREFLSESISTGKPRIDKLIANPGKDEVTLMNISPQKIRQIMAKAQGTTENAAVARRQKMPGFKEKIENLKSLMEKGVKLDVPFVEITSSGSIQDGFHRTLAADEMGVKKMQFVMIKRKK